MANEKLAALVADYLAARAAFVAADKSVDALHKRVAAVASAIGDPKTTNGRRRSESVGAFETWLATHPDPAEIRQTMSDWESKRRAVYSAYQAIPADHRAGLSDVPLSARH
jgi:hypothetical protein